jgi:hypothetical protein
LDVSRGAIVECLTTAPETSIINVDHQRRDRELWNETIVPQALAFTSTFVDLINSQAMQDEYFQARKPAAFLRARMDAHRKKNSTLTWS